MELGGIQFSVKLPKQKEEREKKAEKGKSTNSMLANNLKLVCILTPVRSFVVVPQCRKCD